MNNMDQKQKVGIDMLVILAIAFFTIIYNLIF